MIAISKTKWAGVAIILLLTVVTFAGCIGQEEEPETITPEKTRWEIIQEKGKILIGTESGWPPYEFIEGGKLVGFEIELAETIAERLGLTVEWKDMAFDQIIPEVKAGILDLGVSGFSITPERVEVIQYTIPHSITEGQVIMMKSRADELGITTEFTSLEEMGTYGLTCGTQIGTTQEDELMKLEQAGKLPSGTLKTYEDFPLANEDMKRGAIDAVYAETPPTNWWLLQAEKAGDPMVVVYRRPYWPVAFLAHIDADIFVAKMNGVLAELIATGIVKEMKTKWSCD